MNIGSNIAHLRICKGITQNELARALNVNQSLIANIERGRKNPSVMLLRDIAEHFGVTPNEIMGVGGEKNECNRGHGVP